MLMLILILMLMMMIIVILLHPPHQNAQGLFSTTITSTAPEKKVRTESYKFVSWWGFLAKVPFQNTLKNQHGTPNYEGVW